MKVLPWILSLTVSAALAGSPREHVVDCTPVPQCGDPSAFGDTFAWQHLGPVDFLHLLEQMVKSEHSGNRSPWYTVHGTHRGWIQASDIPELLKLVDSSVPCAAVVSSVSSVLPSERSTVGHEAMYLIEGYRHGGYPSAINSSQCTCDPAEIRRWWDGRGHDERSGS